MFRPTGPRRTPFAGPLARRLAAAGLLVGVIELVGIKAFSVVKLTRAPLLWGAGGVLALLIVAAVAARATRRRSGAAGAAVRAGG